MEIAVVIINKSNEWHLSADKMELKSKSGLLVKRSFNESTGSVSWIPSDNVSKNDLAEALRYLYDVEGRLLISSYIKKYELELETLLSFLNREVKEQVCLKRAEKLDYSDVEMIVLNENTPRELTLDELEKVYSGRYYCEPWISSCIRSALYKWKRNL